MSALPPPTTPGLPVREAASASPWPAPTPGEITLPSRGPVLEPRANVSTLPFAAAAGAIVVLTASLLLSKVLLDALVGFEWPVVAYVVLLGLVGYGPSVAWCWFVSTRWGTGRVFRDVGLLPQWSDIGWGPVLWLGAIGAQLAMGAIVLALDIPISNNTDGVVELQADRTYVISLVITAVLAAPLVEEMVFRGVVLRGFNSRLPVALALVLQALVFGAAHADPVRGLGNLGLVLVLTGVGLALGIGAQVLGRIGPAVVAHALFNGAVLLVVLSGVADNLQ